MSCRCCICSCKLRHGGSGYGSDGPGGRSHATQHHYVAKRFLGLSKNRKGEARTPVFPEDPWKLNGQRGTFCYDCHEELLHNPVFLPEDVEAFAKLVEIRHGRESKKTTGKEKLAKRIILLHEVIEEGTRALLRKGGKHVGSVPGLH